jgi:Prp8 binding protein
MIKVWESRSKKELRCFETKYPLTSIEFSLNGDRLFAGGIDNEIKIFNLGEQKQE